MMINYAPSFHRDSNLAGLEPNFGQYLNVYSATERDLLVDTLFSVEAVNRLIGSIAAAPSRPPVVAIEQLLATRMGESAFGLEAKKLTGRLVRQIVERLGGHWVRRGVKTTVPSRFNRGSIYSF